LGLLKSRAHAHPLIFNGPPIVAADALSGPDALHALQHPRPAGDGRHDLVRRSTGRAAKDRGALFHRGHAGQGDLVVLRAGAAAHPDCPDQLSGDDNGIAARRRDDAV
jgi:hypothetical protein